MRLRTDEVINSILWTHDKYILPSLTDEYAHSLALTTSNLLRHVALRVELEYEMMTDEREDLLAMLDKAQVFAEALDECPSSLAAALQNQDSLGEAVAAERQGPSKLADRIERLWRRLDEVLAGLQASRDDIGNCEGYRQLRQQILSCLARQLDREKLVIEKAFVMERR